ncbi:MAG: 4Fe-4S cluster-binding domain-containing protein [Bacteroidales bacterium]|nr:4Fe-4S cluster-binding domain-containing protein [Bacteroidales bacterium]
MNIASICVHRGEEPPVSGPDGICNIFFSGCNLRCIYCQNHEISRSCRELRDSSPDYDKALERIIRILDSGIKAVGFVSPSHVVPQVKAIIRGLNARGYRPVTVYNTNAYDKPGVIDSLDGVIDVYLPDYKYYSPVLSENYSDAGDYPGVAFNTIKRMYYQKGSVLRTDDDGRAENGMLIRHLVLPGSPDDSKAILKKIAEELSPGVHLSLMSQYHPTPYVMDHPELNRILYRQEYESVVKTMEELGFRNGWVQDMDSYRNYRPDFSREHPFE